MKTIEVKSIQDVIQFLNDYVIECKPEDNCGRCDDGRECVRFLSQFQEQPITMTDDLKQYMTNLLYSAYDKREEHIGTSEFDKWVEEMIEGINGYFVFLKAQPGDEDIEAWAKSTVVNKVNPKNIKIKFDAEYLVKIIIGSKITGAKAMRDGQIPSDHVTMHDLKDNDEAEEDRDFDGDSDFSRHGIGRSESNDIHGHPIR